MNLTREQAANILEEQKLFELYINPSVYVVILLVGLLWNGTLLLIFLRHKEIRTAANSMLLNLVVCDVLNLVINAPLMCVYHYPHSHPEDEALCRLYTGARQFFRCVSALSLVALSIQRFCITTSSINNPAQSNKRSATWITLYLVAVWSLSLAISLPTVLVRGVYKYLCSRSTDERPTAVMVFANVVLYCVLLPGLMFFFSLLTARKLRSSCRDIPGEKMHRSRVQLRNKSAVVVTSLALLFVVSHVPYETWTLAAYWFRAERQSTALFLWEYLSKYLLFADACFNPVALYIASGTFRKLFRKYLCCSVARGATKLPVERQQSQLSEMSDVSQL